MKILTLRKAKHKPSGYSLSLNCSFDKKNRQKFYRRKDCIKKFCDDPKELVTEITNYGEKEMTTLTNKEIKFYEKQKVCHIGKRYFCTNEINEK